ncbi:MAG: ribonuclease HII [Candidatus Aminicenantales bacterium]
MADFWIEKKILKKGFKAIAGVDEAGRGALCGPVVAAAVILPLSLIKGRREAWLEKVNDSKLLTPRQRNDLAKDILAKADSVGIGLATNEEIDRQNIYWASLTAMKRAVDSMAIRPDFLLVDGFCLNIVNYPQIGVRQGDRKSLTIAAASIIAKVLRDKMMRQMDKIYEGYALAKNKGYGTKEHYTALKKKGPCSWHRMSFNLKH